MNFITNFPVSFVASVNFTDGRNASVELEGNVVAIIPAKDGKGNYINQGDLVQLQSKLLQLERNGEFSISHVYSAKRITSPNITPTTVKDIEAQIELIKEAAKFDMLKELMLPSESNVIELDY